MEGIKGKRALVTGGGSGIGLAIARQLVENGATVYILARNKERLDKAVAESGNKMIPIQCDVMDWEGTRKVVRNILPIHLLVNNSGVHISETVLELTEASYDQTLNTNLKGAVNLTQFVANDLISKNLPGRIVNVSSMLGHRALETYFAYCCSKAGMDMATKCFALELGPKNIRVNSVNPTYVVTDLTKEKLSNPEFYSKVVSKIPMGRIATADEMANATLFLLSDKSEMISGHTLLVDGGYTAT